MGPLSAKQHREYLAFMGKEQREQAKLAREEARKDELHALKLVESGAKAVQGLAQKDDTHKVKMKEMGGKPTSGASPLSMQSIAPQMFQPTNPEAGPSDTVPAMLTPGEAVIPAPAAQDPTNKPLIKAMVEQGRSANDALGYASGTRSVSGTQTIPKAVGGKGSRRTVLPKIARINQVGFASGTEKVPDKKEPPLGSGMAEEARKALKDRKQQLEEQERKALGYADGTLNAGDVGLMSSIFGKSKPATQDPDFVESVLPFLIKQESGGKHIDPKTKQLLSSPVGARGITQVMPKTGFDPGYGVKPLENETQGEYLRFGRDYLGAMYKEYNDPRKALAAYNAGPGRVNELIKKHGADWEKYAPQETRDYIPTILSNLSGGQVKQPKGEWGLAGEPTVPLPKHLTIEGATGGKYGPTPVISNQEENKKLVMGGSTPKEPTSVPPLKDSNFEYKMETPAAELPTEIPKLPVTAKEVGDRAVSILEDPEKLAILEMYQNEAPTVPEEQKKSFLEDMFSKIYGETGLFNEQDLARFSVIAAGGLLTGGSVAGSLRYAARDTLQVSDARRAGQAASSAEAAKDERELGQQLDGRIAEYMSKDVPADVRAKALTMRRMPVRDRADTIKRDREIVQYLSANVQHKDKNAGSELGGFKTGYFNGNPVQYYDDKKGGVILRSPNGSLTPLPPNSNFMDDTTYYKRKSMMQDSVKKSVAPTLRKIYGKNKDANIDELADKMSVTFDAVYDDLGSPDPKYFAQIVEGATRSIQRDDDVGDLEEAMRRGVYGQAALAVNPSDTALFKHGPKKDKMPSIQGLGQFGSVVEDLVGQAKARATAEGVSPDKIGIQTVSQTLIKEFNAAKKSAPEKVREAERAALTAEDKDSPFYGMSPFMVWVTQNKR